jgi:hypothetical protein
VATKTQVSDFLLDPPTSLLMDFVCAMGDSPGKEERRTDKKEHALLDGDMSPYQHFEF